MALYIMSGRRVSDYRGDRDGTEVCGRRLSIGRFLIEKPIESVGCPTDFMV